MNVQSYEEILSDMKNYMIANQSKITDFNDGSIILTMFEAISRIVEMLYIDARNGYQNNLKATPYSVFAFKRKPGLKATANVVFSRTEPINEISLIPVGTQISAGSYIFYTTAVGKIESGKLDSGVIPCEAAEIGVNYNVNAGTINTIDSALPSDIMLVNNAVRASGGSNNESESEMLARFKTYINGLQGTNTYGLKSTVLSVEGVRSCSVKENFPPVNGIYNFDVYIDDGTGNITDSLKDKVEKAIEGEDKSVNPGCRAAGVMCQVAAASPVNVDVSLIAKVYRTDDATARYDIQQAIEEEINVLGINENVVLTTLIMRLRKISYLKDIKNLTLSGASLETGNVEIGFNQIARCGEVNVIIETA